MKKTTLLVLMLLPVIFLSCSKRNYENVPHSYFTKEYVNTAWGYSHQGWMIDDEGAVRSFNMPDNWHDVDSLGYISAADLQDNLASCNVTIDKVSKLKLNQQNRAVGEASEGTVTSPENTAYDLGQTEYFCYIYMDAVSMYKKVLLAAEGDFTYYNTSSAASDITKWMKKQGN